jgi:rhodanese-related sulfurtransferase
VLDVRTPEEYEAGHLRGARSAPGGQVVQETNSFVATWGARIVLDDDNDVRATMTASWLKQMGWDEVAVLTAAPADSDWVRQRRRHRDLRQPLLRGISQHSIPTAISVPGAELVYRFADLTPSPDTTVIVNCGGSRQASRVSLRSFSKTVSRGAVELRQSS